MKKREEKSSPPSFWKSLFCKHNWEEINGVVVYSSPENMKIGLPIRKYKRWQCRKCSKIKKYLIL